MPSALISVSGDGIERRIFRCTVVFLVILKSLVGKCFILIFFWAVSQNLYLFKPSFCKLHLFCNPYTGIRNEMKPSSFKSFVF